MAMLKKVIYLSLFLSCVAAECHAATMSFNLAKLRHNGEYALSGAVLQRGVIEIDEPNIAINIDDISTNGSFRSISDAWTHSGSRWLYSVNTRLIIDDYNILHNATLPQFALDYDVSGRMITSWYVERNGVRVDSGSRTDAFSESVVGAIATAEYWRNFLRLEVRRHPGVILDAGSSVINGTYGGRVLNIGHAGGSFNLSEVVAIPEPSIMSLLILVVVASCFCRVR